MGYGMYTLVLPFFAWMIVLVVSAVRCQPLLLLAIQGLHAAVRCN